MKIYVTVNKDSWLELLPLTSDLQQYGKNNYDSIVKLLPKTLGVVKVFDKKTNTHIDKQIFRFYDNYLYSPKFDEKVKKSYMFNNSGFKELPSILDVFYKTILNLSPAYNQLVMNHYKDGSNFIEAHSDCTSKMIEDHSIAIVTINEHDKEYRSMVFTSRSSMALFSEFILPLKDDTIIIMGGKFQEHYRHGINEDISIQSGRVSLTFRQMDLNKLHGGCVDAVHQTTR